MILLTRFPNYGNIVDQCSMSILLGKRFVLKNSFNLRLLSSAIVNNKLVESNTRFESINLATGEVVGVVANCGVNETIDAIESANKCFKKFKKSQASDRARLLINWADLIIKNQQSVAELVTQEMGKPISESIGEVNYAASFLNHFAAQIKTGLTGEVLTPGQPHWRPINIRQPVGPVATITPWNFPIAMVTRKAGAAIAAGCSVINAPSEDTPLTSIYLGKLAIEAGFPEGLLNIIPSCRNQKAEIGKILCEHHDISALSFTGSTAVGKLLSRQCADTVKRVHLELGGNAPLIVFESADIDRAITGTMLAKFRNAGQACNAANRIFVHSSIYPTYIEKLAAKVSKLKVGNGLVKGMDLGPLVNLKASAKVTSLVNEATQTEGIEIIKDNFSVHDSETFYTPTILSCHDKTDVSVFDQEIFGPVAAIYSFETESEVIELANRTRYGLQAFIFTRDLSQSWRASEDLEYGMVAVNEGAISSANNPFGGWKESGIGREAGHLGVDEFTESKLICFGM